MCNMMCKLHVERDARRDALNGVLGLLGCTAKSTARLFADRPLYRASTGAGVRHLAIVECAEASQQGLSHAHLQIRIVSGYVAHYVISM